MSERIHQKNTEDNLSSLRKQSEQSPAGASPKQVQRAVENPTPGTLTPDVIDSLQSSHGNQFVNRLVQRMESDNETTLSHPIQAKMTVTAADDKYENEADAVAKDVVSAISSGQVQRGEDEDAMMMKRDTIQRMDEEEEMMMKRDTIQRAADFEEGGDVSGGIENKIESSRGSGKPLDDGTRSNMEGAFGADFSNVRVHTGAESDALNNAVQAKAFTTGSDIFFRSGEYNPNSSSGQELLAHELTHTIQQGAAGVQKKDDEQ